NRTGIHQCDGPRVRIRQLEKAGRGVVMQSDRPRAKDARALAQQRFTRPGEDPRGEARVRLKIVAFSTDHQVDRLARRNRLSEPDSHERAQSSMIRMRACRIACGQPTQAFEDSVHHQQRVARCGSLRMGSDDLNVSGHADGRASRGWRWLVLRTPRYRGHSRFRDGYEPVTYLRHEPDEVAAGPTGPVHVHEGVAQSHVVGSEPNAGSEKRAELSEQSRKLVSDGSRNAAHRTVFENYVPVGRCRPLREGRQNLFLETPNLAHESGAGF